MSIYEVIASGVKDFVLTVLMHISAKKRYDHRIDHNSVTSLTNDPLKTLCYGNQAMPLFSVFKTAIS